MTGIEKRLREFYTVPTDQHPERGRRFWEDHREELIADVVARTGSRRWTKEFNHKTRRDMERHPLDYAWADLVRSRVLDKLRDHPEGLSFEERYYIQTGEQYVPSRYPEARYGEEQTGLARYFDPWTGRGPLRGLW
jgi:hypothetical protein